MICRYCELIHSKDQSYPLREATRDLDSDFPRCDWHWRYVCDICGKPRHFNGTTWCEKAEKFICISCGPDHRFPEGEFWKWDAYYAIGCPYCDVRHPALDRLEFEGQHPWQLHPEMLRRRVGLSDENDTRSYSVTRRFLPEGDAVSDEMVGEAWDRGADIWYSRYGDFGDLNRQYVIDPAILEMLGRVEEKRILDAGCGNGYLCRLLSKKGAEMVGVDVSKRAIEIAEDIEKNEPMNIEYHVGSVCNLSMCSDDEFDAVVSNLVLQDLQNIDKAVEELQRVLKPEGKLVFSIMHPCFSSAPVHGWVRKPVDSNRKEDRIYWKVDRYFDRSIEEWTYFDLPPIYSFHRPLSDYMKVLVKNGFTITDFEEPVPTDKDMEEHYKEFGNEYDRIPWFLIIGAINQGKKK
jgi:ubiquinone/menaquinone biosynthesis C-methylase UbiE